MQKEWNSPWNPFNSAKVLMWREWLDGFAKGEYLPPVTVDTDPSSRCNYLCLWCNADSIIQKNGQKEISRDQLFRLSDFYAEWGIHSSCVAGGGEPLMNKNTPDFLIHLRKNGIEPGLITNGSLIDDRIAQIIAENWRLVGFSMDAATPETYRKIKGLSLSHIDTFSRVIFNMKKVVDFARYSNCNVCYKYLLHPLNAREILSAARIAKAVGVHDFHLRPVGWDNVPKTAGQEAPDYTGLYEEIDNQIEQAMLLEDDSFHFYGIRHKFKPDFSRQINFSRCWAAPLILTFGADGNCHLCFDMRGREDLILCRHDPDPHEVLKHWNSQRHKDIIKNIDVNKCPRCTFGAYNKIVEDVFIEDKMCRYFP